AEHRLEPFDGTRDVVTADFAVRFECLEDALRNFPSDSAAGNIYAAASLPREAVVTTPLSPNNPLPILQHFIGPGGVGPEGKVCNLLESGLIASENHLAIPLLRTGAIFLTLYMALKTPVPEQPSPMPCHPVKAKTYTKK